MKDHTYESALWERMSRDVEVIRRRSLLGPWRLRPLRWLASANVEFKKQDAWIGAFWKRTPLDPFDAWDLWICLVPCFPLHIWWYRERPTS